MISNRYNLYWPRGAPGVFFSYTTDLTLAVPKMLPVKDGLVPVITVVLDVVGTVGTAVPNDVESLLPAVSNNFTSAA